MSLCKDINVLEFMEHKETFFSPFFSIDKLLLELEHQRSTNSLAGQEDITIYCPLIDTTMTGAGGGWGVGGISLIKFNFAFIFFSALFHKSKCP